MKLEVDMLPDVLGHRIAIAFPCSVISQFGQIVGLKLYTVYLVIASKACNYGLCLVRRQRILAVFVRGKLVKKLLFCKLPAPLLFGSKAFWDGKERHYGPVVNAIDFYLI